MASDIQAPGGFGEPTIDAHSTLDDAHEHDGSDVDGDSEDDEYILTQDTPRPQKVSEKLRNDVDVFQTWLTTSQRDRSLRKRDTKTSQRQSAADRLLEQDSTKIIDAPREYQMELFERAKEKNIIVVLDTGSGKTLIAVLLLNHMLENEIRRRADEMQAHGPRTAFFIVEKVALCLQQHRVLRHNLSYPIGVVYGDLQGVTNRKEFWQTQLADNMAVVTTAQVLLDSLSNGFVRMSGINLLVFDEAHHTKKNHPYAKIIKSHYLREPHATPKILGMTASPVDAQTRDMRSAAAELEGIMCSEIATVSDDVLRNTPRAMEAYEQFERLLPKEQTRTALWEHVNALVSENPLFRTALEFAEEASSTLGPWCADRFWSLLMTDLEVAKLVAKTEGDMENQSLDSINQSIVAIHRIQELTQEYARQRNMEVHKGLSSKFQLLLDILRDQFENGTSRCIVFVEKRYTALLLSEMLREDHIQIPGVVAAHLVGSNSASSKSSAIATMTFREQVDVLFDFKHGNVNCLFTTTVAEEGIDIPACDLVIRWDMYNSMIQYIQSRGRARQKNSRFISLVESGNTSHRRRCEQAMRDSTALRQFCSALPEDRKVQDTALRDVAAVARAEDAGQKSFDIQATGARITYQNCFDVLARFVSSLMGPSDSNFHPEFGVMPMGPQFKAHVILPEVSPVTYVSGHPQRSKQMARRSAAYETCVMLYEKKYIDDNLQSSLARRLPAMRNARLAISSQKKADYAMRIKPEIWSKTGAVSRLFHTILTLDNPRAVGNTLTPLALLTRQPLPTLPSIPLYFGTGHTSLAMPTSSDKAMEISPEKLQALRGFTLKLFDDFFSKQYEAEASDMPYFLAPMLESKAQQGSFGLDWKTVLECQVDSYLAWEGQPTDFFRDKLVVDPLDGSRKFITLGINPNLRPSDPTPADAPLPKSRAYRSVEPTIKEYSNSYYLNRRKTVADMWREDQPVVDAELLSLRRNFLDQFFVDEAKSRSCSIILQPLKVSPIPIGVVNMTNLIPAIIHRIDQTLIALEACALLGLDKIRPELALEACTKDSDNSEEHSHEQVNFQHGMGNNYERLEFLGDSFLKMATTISLFTIMPSMREFESHTARMVQIANQNLFNHAVDRRLQEYVRSKSFDRRLWYPDLPLKKGKAPKAVSRHSLADKSIADVCEALIGAAYLSDEGMNLAVRAVTKMVKSSYHKMKSWKDYYAAYKNPEWMNAAVTEVQRAAVASIAHKIGYTFQSPALLRSACKHPSYHFDSVPDYQRLEFLGDALLDMVVVDHLFRTFPLADPQWLTEHKMAIVSNQFLCCLCVKLGLHNHILLTTSTLLNQRTEFATNVERAEAAAAAVADKDNSGNVPRDFWRDVEQPPKALADVVEALVGAMFVDAKYDYRVVQDFFTRHVLPYFEDMTLYDSFAEKHPVTSLSRRLNDLGCQDWRLLSGEVPCAVDKGVQAVTQSEVVCALLIHGRHFEHATAQSGRYAKIDCARRASQWLAEVAPDDFRREVHCDCSAVNKTEHGQRKGDAGMAI